MIINAVETFDKTKLPSVIIKPTNGVANGIKGDVITYAFSDLIANDDKGTISCTINLAKGDENKRISAIISGFKTNYHVEIEKIINSLNLDKTQLPSAINKIADGTINTSVAYTFNTWNLNDEDGTITWVVTLYKGAASKQISGVISGFKTNDGVALETISNIDIESAFDANDFSKANYASTIS